MNELAGGDWLNIGDFEELFWEQSQKIRSSDPKATKEGKFFVSQHPSRSTDGPGSKLVDEWLPLLILAKHEVGRKKNWDAPFYLRVSNGEDAVTNDGRSYDAEYCFKDYNLGYGEARRVRLGDYSWNFEPAKPRPERKRDRALSQGIRPALEVREHDAGLTDMKEQILAKPLLGREKWLRQRIYPEPQNHPAWILATGQPIEFAISVARRLQEEKLKDNRLVK
ncbi:hypothetical protein [Nioella sp.]|uniref:hypothetical protein n=1 Tax=Nioella sp. TaxID=1912091 RepID=UPI003A849C3E